MCEAAVRLAKEAKYYNAGTCEFLIGPDSSVVFLEVNTRVQVEHPVTEEATGVDIIREMFQEGELQQLLDDKGIAHDAAKLTA